MEIQFNITQMLKLTEKCIKYYKYVQMIDKWKMREWKTLEEK